MRPEQARELKERWGYAGPAPNDTWVWCSWCGEPWPDTPGYWSARSGRRICRACRRDHDCGGGKPRPDAWHRKNRWTPDGELLRRCSRCGAWKPIVRYHASIKRNEVMQAHTWCASCMNHPPRRYLAARPPRRKRR